MRTKENQGFKEIEAAGNEEDEDLKKHKTTKMKETTETKEIEVEIEAMDEVKIGGITNLKFNVMFVRTSAPMLQVAIINPIM